MMVVFASGFSNFIFILAIASKLLVSRCVFHCVLGMDLWLNPRQRRRGDLLADRFEWPCTC